MKILQLIDSLQAGGAERMAVNYANEVLMQTDFCALVTTRDEGPLKDDLNIKVSYHFLHKKSAYDFAAIWKLKNICVNNKIDVLHAHGSSIYMASVVKIMLPGIKLVYHDHYGISAFFRKKYRLLSILSTLFSGIIVVNDELKIWALQKLHCGNVVYIPNFVTTTPSSIKTVLKGVDGKRLLMVANLREQKDHPMLVDAVAIVFRKYPDWTLHLVGADYNDLYSKKLKQSIIEFNIEENIFIYGNKKNIPQIIKQCDIGLLSSKSEGLPLSLLEYGLHSICVIATAVGQTSEVVQNNENGYLVPVGDASNFAKSICNLIENPELRELFATRLFNTVANRYDKKSVIQNYLHWIKTL